MQLTRRTFLEGLGAATIAAGVEARGDDEKKQLNKDWKPGAPIKYARDQAPPFEIPPYPGDRYEAMVPDTLDLAERAEWGVNALTGCTDRHADFEIYGNCYWRNNPAWMQHDFSDHGQPRFMESLPLMRIASGSNRNPEVERKWLEVALRSIGADGLAYTTLIGRPWGAAHHTGCIPEGVDVSGMTEYPDATVMGGLLATFMLYHKRGGGKIWQETAQRMVDALSKLVIDKGRYAYYSPSPHFVIKGYTDDWGRRNPMFGVGSDCVHGIIYVYRETGYEPARKLADKLLRYVLDEIKHIDEQGRFTPDYTLNKVGVAHFHGHTEYLFHALEHALLTKDQALIERVQKGYQYAKDHGDTRLGYFPEWIYVKPQPQTGNSETCEVADMITTAALLSRSGIADHWDDVDRWVRNQFAENQLSPSRSDWMLRYAKSQPARKPGPYDSSERMQERTIGSFTGTPRPNDWGFAWSNCCTENGTRSMYHVWQDILNHQDGKLKVNLLLNRASRWADVDSHIPYTGQVDVRVKEPVDLSVRIPEWVKPADVRVQVKNQQPGFGATAEDRQVEYQGRYAKVGAVKPGDVVMLTFPIAEQTYTCNVLPERCSVILKGNDVVAISPPGKNCPLFQRDHYRVNATRWRKVQRFVSQENLYW